MVHSNDSETESEYFEESDDDAPPCGIVADTRDAAVYGHAACSFFASLEAAQQPPTSANSSITNTNNTTRATALPQMQPPQTTQFKQEQGLVSSSPSPVPAQAFVSPFASLALPTGSHSAPIATVKTESIATDVVSGPPSQEREYRYCTQCKAPLCFESSYSASANTSMCLCCKRPVVVIGLSANKRNRRIIWRCPECTAPPSGHSEEILSQLVAALPERVQNAVAILKAQAAITGMITKFHKAFPAASRVFASPAFKQIEIDLRQRQDDEFTQFETREQAIRQGTTIRDDVFAQWLEIKDRRLELAVKKIVLWGELLESLGRELPECVKLYLGGAGTRRCAASLEEPVCCGGCVATLLPTPAVSGSSPAFCDCCKRMVPLVLMAETLPQSSFAKAGIMCGKTRPMCRVCDSARVTKVPSNQLQSQRPSPLPCFRVDAKWIENVASVATGFKPMQSSSIRLETERNEIPIYHKLRMWKCLSHAFQKRLCHAILKGSASVSASRQLYAEQVAVDEGLLAAYEKLLIARVERRKELKIRLPSHTYTVVYKVYADHGMPSPKDLFEETKSVKSSPPPSLVQCKGCLEQLTPTPKAKGSIGFCDCCQCVLPMASIAEISDDTCVSICQTCCKARPLETLCRDNRVKKRLPRE